MNSFELLHISPTASLEQTRRAYHHQIKLWHPDRYAHDPVLQAEAEERTKQITLAYHSVLQFFATGVLEPTARLRTTSNTFAAPRGETLHPPKTRPISFGSYSAKRYSYKKKRHGYACLLVLALLSVPLGSIGMPSSKSPQPSVVRHVPQLEAATSAPSRELRATPAAARKPLEYASLETRLVIARPRLVQSTMVCDVVRARTLLTSGADANEADAYGDTALIWAVKSNCESVVRLLLEYGANAGYASSNGLTPLAWARNYRNEKLTLLFARVKPQKTRPPLAPNRSQRAALGLSQIS